MASHPSLTDRLLITVDEGLRTCFARPGPEQPSPSRDVDEADLSPAERAESIALMRVNHAGEIAAQALYAGQAVFARDERTFAQLTRAASEERDHLAWCAGRLAELGGRTSVLSPFWYAGSAAIGMAASLAGDKLSLGFVNETETQVEAHLNDHLSRLPANDARSRSILERMSEDESRHAREAAEAGGQPLPAAIRKLMGLGGGILRQTARLL